MRVLGCLLWSIAFFPCSTVEARNVLEAMAPPFDETLRSRGYDGAVQIEVEVDAGGSVTRATVVDSFVPINHKEFEETVVAYAKKWRFETGLESSTELIEIVFELVPRTQLDAMGVAFRAPATMEVRAAWPIELFEIVDPIIKRKK